MHIGINIQEILIGSFLPLNRTSQLCKSLLGEGSLPLGLGLADRTQLLGAAVFNMAGPAVFSKEIFPLSIVSFFDRKAQADNDNGQNDSRREYNYFLPHFFYLFLSEFLWVCE
jgi:hypothetical protein